MRIRTLLTVLAFAATGHLQAAFAEPTAIAPAAAPQDTASLQTCLAKAKGDKLAQIDCCNGHKGICGCRAGKLVCCDGTTSNEPGCTCHGDEPLVQ